jgi:outer membrane protein OmpA-like peptidoglycan-associated protein
MHFIFFAFSLILCKISFTQKFSGTWQGMYLLDSTNLPERTHALYLKLDVINGLIDAKCRVEQFSSKNYGYYSLNGTIDRTTLTMKFSKKIKESGMTLGDFNLVLSYNEVNGYLKGQLVKKGEKVSESIVVLYKQEVEWQESNQQSSHNWLNRLKKDIANGVSSPALRKEELKAFKFQSIYFDYDKFFLRPSYHDYLLGIVKTLNSHSDLRLKITGHTDGDGSNAYNIALSKNRAQAIIKFFNDRGIEKSRIVIDFKGETSPIDSNESEEGKQRNRRVDFEFI